MINEISAFQRQPEKRMDQKDESSFVEFMEKNRGIFFPPIVDYILKMTNITEGGVLEVACGPGFLSQELASRNPNLYVTAVDFSERMLHIAREKCREANLTFNLVRSDVANLPFNQGLFDLIMCKDSLHEFPCTFEEVITELLRVAKKHIVVCDLRRDLPPAILEKVSRASSAANSFQIDSIKASYTPQEIENNMRELQKELPIKSYSLTQEHVVNEIVDACSPDIRGKVRNVFDARFFLTIERV